MQCRFSVARKPEHVLMPALCASQPSIHPQPQPGSMLRSPSPNPPSPFPFTSASPSYLNFDGQPATSLAEATLLPHQSPPQTCKPHALNPPSVPPSLALASSPQSNAAVAARRFRVAVTSVSAEHACFTVSTDAECSGPSRCCQQPLKPLKFKSLKITGAGA